MCTSRQRNENRSAHKQIMTHGKISGPLPFLTESNRCTGLQNGVGRFAQFFRRLNGSWEEVEDAMSGFVTFIVENKGWA